ncbi:Small-conductance mechanosensitive channel [Limimonas halophila]|uniref:Small-conductance mechanosensitive channel n=2 Tax=Limimonas halophila TaxID=1082479 RepID=A0A1G7R781_9PROT|nr:Small-conductance mechanosensitive channel [Limimonas halophila]
MLRVCRLTALLAVLLAGLTAALPATAQAQAAEDPVDRQAVERLIQKLDDPEARAELKAELQALIQAERAAEPEAEPQPQGLGGRLLAGVNARMGVVAEQLDSAAATAAAVPGAVAGLAAKASDPAVLRQWAEMLVRLVVTLAAGALASWIAARLLRRPRHALADRLAAGLGLRALYLLGRTLLDLVPIAAFAGVAYAVLPALGPGPGTRLVALTLVNAHVLVALVLVAARFLLVPHAPALRLVPLSDEGAHSLYRWARGFVQLAVYGFFLLEAALLLGLPAPAQGVLMKLLGLGLTVIAVRFVLRHRGEVAAVLRREPGESGERRRLPRVRVPQAVGMVRARLADVWHLLASLVVVALYLTWALEVPGGFAFLARALALTLLVVVGAQLAVRGGAALIVRLFRSTERFADRVPGLPQRAARYEGPVRRLITGVIAVLAVLAVLHAWGLGSLAWLTSDHGSALVANLVSIALIVAGTFVAWEVASILIERSLSRESETGASTRKQTLLPLVHNVVRIALTVIAAMIVLSQIGLDIGPLLAGAGVIGLAVGFGAQALVKDVITGGFLLMENALSVGDWIEAGGHAGEVERLTIRTVTLRDLAGTVHVLPFSDVTSVTNYNRGYGYALIDAGVAYRERTEEVVRLLHRVADELRNDPEWSPFILGELEVFGLNNLGDSAVEIRVRMKTRPLKQFAVKRAFLERMKRVFDENGVEIPFPHRTLYFGVEKDGSAPPVHVAQESPATA